MWQISSRICIRVATACVCQWQVDKSSVPQHAAHAKQMQHSTTLINALRLQHTATLYNTLQTCRGMCLPVAGDSNMHHCGMSADNTCQRHMTRRYTVAFDVEGVAGQCSQKAHHNRYCKTKKMCLSQYLTRHQLWMQLPVTLDRSVTVTVDVVEEGPGEVEPEGRDRRRARQRQSQLTQTSVIDY